MEHNEPVRFRITLDDGETVEADCSTITDEESGAQVPAVIIRMSRSRAHSLALVLSGWSRASAAFDIYGGVAAVTEDALARALDTGAAALGDSIAMQASERVSASVSASQRLAALAVLEKQER